MLSCLFFGQVGVVPRSARIDMAAAAGGLVRGSAVPKDEEATWAGWQLWAQPVEGAALTSYGKCRVKGEKDGGRW
jgi:hypothetical protein